MRIINSENRFGIVAIFLHWVMAIMIIGLLAFGLYMVYLPISLAKLKWYGWHKEWGLFVLGVAVFRYTWRLKNISPALTIPLWEKIIARLVHWAFYLFMFAMPITGWLITSAAGLPVSFFGLFVVPNLIMPSKALREFFQTAHQFLAYGLIALIVLHTLAALKHHFVNKDDILRRMLS